MRSRTLDAVIADLESREAQGLITYGCTVDRADLTRTDWVRHAYHEALDLAMYLCRVLTEEGNDERLVDSRGDSDGDTIRSSADGLVAGNGGNGAAKDRSPRISVRIPVSLVSESFYCSVYIALLMLREEDGGIDANMRRLSGMLDMSKTTIQRALRYLREQGYIDRLEGGTTRNVRYRIR